MKFHNYPGEPNVLRTGCKCGVNKLYLSPTRQSAARQEKRYYFTAIWKCDNCKRIYLDERFKILNRNK